MMQPRGIELWWVLRWILEVSVALLCGGILYHLTFKEPPVKKRRAGWQVVTPVERVRVEGDEERVRRPEARYNHRSVHAPLAGKVFTTFGYRCVCGASLRLSFSAPYMAFFSGMQHTLVRGGDSPVTS